MSVIDELLAFRSAIRRLDHPQLVNLPSCHMELSAVSGQRSVRLLRGIFGLIFDAIEYDVLE